LELINDCSKAAEYKINIQKSVAFLYTNDETLKNKENYPFHNSTKNNKIPRNKFKQMKDLYNKNYKTVKKIKETNKRKTSHVYGAEELIL